ncbi:MAG: ATP-binding cassette domain-containing protein [Deltaproteobacteria bacterium]|nr:ATP-binding cassette domain-containing protein [Deltaproteobacteria bacterium]
MAGPDEKDAQLAPAIELVGVTKRYGKNVILDDVSVKMPSGKTTVLLGPSGTGKSTLIRLAVGLSRPEEGKVFALGDEVTSLSHQKLLLLRQRFGMLFQEGALFGSLTVGQNVGFPLKHHTKKSKVEIEARVDELLEWVGLSGTKDRAPDALSGGQRKRVALARAIALEPEMVFFDEPTSGLDPQTSAAIDDLICGMQARLGLSFVVITHDVQSAKNIAHQVGVLHESKLRAWGPAHEVWQSDDEIVRHFLDRVPPGKTKATLR